MSDELITGTSFYPFEPLIARLRGMIRDYPDCLENKINRPDRIEDVKQSPNFEKGTMITLSPFR